MVILGLCLTIAVSAGSVAMRAPTSARSSTGASARTSLADLRASPAKSSPTGATGALNGATGVGVSFASNSLVLRIR